MNLRVLKHALCLLHVISLGKRGVNGVLCSDVAIRRILFEGDGEAACKLDLAFPRGINTGMPTGHVLMLKELTQAILDIGITCSNPKMLCCDMNKVPMPGLECVKQNLAALSPSIQSFFGLCHSSMTLMMESRDVREYLEPLRFRSLSFNKSAGAVQSQ